ncbi:hypothetical protein [Bernardetia sp.]|uniref:hypothetical protein n=1 Tax=Bernardetia sp. TaxID=1937974 RepID=UPI0025C60CA8|nr:hypothetical protein [Bernardetia sp.]
MKLKINKFWLIIPLLWLFCCKPSQKIKKENYCKFIQRVNKELKSDITLEVYLPTSADIARQSTYIQECREEIKFFYAFKQKHDALYKKEIDWNSDDWFEPSLMKIQEVYYCIQSREKDICFEEAPLYQSFKEAESQYLFLKRLYQEKGYSNYNLSNLEVENCHDTIFFLYRMLDDMPLKYDASFGNIYLIDTKEQFYKKLKDRYGEK